MSTEEKLIDFQARYEEREKRWLREERTNAAVFGALAVIALIALVYGFSQQIDAVKATVEAEVAKTVAERQVTELKKQLLIEMEKSATCERSLAAIQSANSKPGK